MSKKRATKNHSSNNDKEKKKRTESYKHWKIPRHVEGEERKVHEEIMERRLGGGAAPTEEAFEEEERKVHEEIIDRRLGGGAAPTEEAYSRALKQWQNLPGSIISPPTDVILPNKKSPKSHETLDDSELTTNKTDKEKKTR